MAEESGISIKVWEVGNSGVARPRDFCCFKENKVEWVGCIGRYEASARNLGRGKQKYSTKIFFQ